MKTSCPPLQRRSYYNRRTCTGALDKGIQYVWLHRGKLGSALFKKTETLQLNAPAANVVDCTGAGDGSVSGFILSKYFGKDNLNSLRTAHTLSAENYRYMALLLHILTRKNS